MTDADGFLTRKNLSKYFKDGVPITLPVGGDPKAFLVIDPGAKNISLRVPRDAGGLPNLDEFEAILALEIHWNQANWYQVTVGGTVAHDAYVLLKDICDRVQHESMLFSEATHLSLQAFRDLLAGASRMSREQEIGLIGELLVLKHLISKVGASTAISQWRGWDKAEHDFDLGSEDLEIKATTNEIRLHRISSITQLVPSPFRDLWLLSIQFTDAAEGSADAFNLTHLVAEILGSVDVDSSRIELIERLSKARWLDRHASLYTSWFRIRTEAVHFLVEENFPALTPSKLETLGLDQSITSVNYVVDLSSAQPAQKPPIAMTDFLKSQ